MQDDDFLAECPAMKKTSKMPPQYAKFLNIEFKILSLVQEYREKVVDYLKEWDGYRRGITPNDIINAFTRK